VVIELRARFDEQENIHLANRLQKAGAHVVYGVVGYKTHAKMMLIVRQEGGQLRRYAHLGTGNYHPRTARLYNIFLQLTGLGKVSKLDRLLEAPFTLHAALLEKIEREANNARQGKPARIIVKLNALVASHPRPLPCLHGGSGDRSDRARNLLPAPRRERDLRANPGALHHRFPSRPKNCATASWTNCGAI